MKTLKNKTEVFEAVKQAISKKEKDIYLTISEDVSIEDLSHILCELLYSKYTKSVDSIKKLNETILECNMTEYYNSEDNTDEGAFECKILLQTFDLPIAHTKKEIMIELEYFESYEEKRSHWYFDGMSDECFESYEESEEDFIPHAMAVIIEEFNTYTDDFCCISTETYQVECFVFETIDEVFDNIRDVEDEIDKSTFLETLNSFLSLYPVFKTDFLNLLLSHKKSVSEISEALVNRFMIAITEHDLDKIFNNETYGIYSEHFAKLKAIPFTDPKYKEYEEKYFPQAHYNHNQEAHQFYDYRHKPDTKVNLLLLLEVVVDITATAKAYGNTDPQSITDIIYNKGNINNLVSKEVIFNTVQDIL